MNNSTTLLVRAVVCALAGLASVVSTARADDPCQFSTTIQTLGSTFHRWGNSDWFKVEYSVHVTGNDPCGEFFEYEWQTYSIVYGDPTRSCTDSTAQVVRIDATGPLWCDYCLSGSDSDWQFRCCDIPDAARYLDVPLQWPPVRSMLWRFSEVGDPDPSNPDCLTFELQHYDTGAGTHMRGTLLADGALLQPVDLESNLDVWDSERLCFPNEPCALLALAFDVATSCSGGEGVATQGMLVGRNGDDASCTQQRTRQARVSPGSRAVVLTTADGLHTASLSRAVPAGISSVRWSVYRQAGGTSGMLTDGLQPTGSIVSGSDTPNLSVANVTADDLGVYTFWGLPSGGSPGDEIAIDSMRLVADVGQPEFVQEPVGVEVAAFEPAVMTAATAAPAERLWRANGVPLFEANAAAQGGESAVIWIDGWQLRVHPEGVGEVSIEPMWFFGGNTDMNVTCEAFDGHGGVMSYEARLEARSFRAYLSSQQGWGAPRIGVWTSSQYGQNAYHMTLETSVDLGQHWVGSQVTLQHTGPGEMYSEVPIPIDHPCAAIALVRATVSDGFAVVGTLDQVAVLPRIAGSDCTPDSVDFTDFRCPTCPPDVRVPLDAEPGEDNAPFTIVRTLPPGDWQVRWAWMSYGLPTPEFEFITDGPTGRMGSSASGSSTASLTISRPSWYDLGQYAMFVRDASASDSPEFCVDVVDVRYDPCGTRVISSPESQRLCPGTWTWNAVATSAREGEMLQLNIDDRYWLGVFADPTDWMFDDPAVPGDEVSFTIRAVSPTEFEVTNYVAAGHHTFSGYIYDPTGSCGGWYSAPINTMAVWHVTDGSCSSCPSDIDGSGEVDFGDGALILLDYGPCPGCPTDLDGSGEVDFGDYALALLDFGLCP